MVAATDVNFMIRIAFFCGLTGAYLGFGTLIMAQDAPPAPVMYDVSINGENFRIEGNRVVQVDSKANPGTTYKVAIRVSPTQPLRLNTVQLEYPLPSAVTDDHGKELRTVQIKQMGFSMMIKDLGPAFDAKQVDKVLKMLLEFVTAPAKDQGATGVTTDEPVMRKYAHAAGPMAKIRYILPNAKDPNGEGEEHVALACVLTGPSFAVTLVIDCLKKNVDDVGPMISEMLNSIQAI